MKVKSAKKHLCDALCCRTARRADFAARVVCEHWPGIARRGTAKQ
ncbi:hypothetical protein SPAB_03357 [Salmonella enterica subsp. enterica serovar Paratyphi B str. SPB7]|uniref:Uncharacterized protein n=1 Tax=Salmonella paratyphi B (strain ATCC BAA-1250 / SPB7) TaxID=1016998 RepID=A0A6C6Z5I0_SALPB|nr:hypothetical protein SPAB_03357 [Salmonella enterica subsp. enterica serovar Paratyphi B str. SPB7]